MQKTILLLTESGICNSRMHVLPDSKFINLDDSSIQSQGNFQIYYSVLPGSPHLQILLLSNNAIMLQHHGSINTQHNIVHKQPHNHFEQGKSNNAIMLQHHGIINTQHNIVHKQPHNPFEQGEIFILSDLVVQYHNGRGSIIEWLHASSIGGVAITVAVVAVTEAYHNRGDGGDGSIATVLTWDQRWQQYISFRSIAASMIDIIATAVVIAQ